MSNNRYAYLGPKGTYTELALNEFIRPADSVPCNSITDVFDLIASGEISAGFVPLENLLQGPVTETLDCLYALRGRVYIDDSYLMDIRHSAGWLPGASGSAREIKRIIAHPQAIEQCRDFLRRRFPNAERVNASSNARAAAQIRENNDQEAVALAAAQTLRDNGFEIIEESIADATTNRTRFIVVRPGNSEQHLRKLPGDNAEAEGAELSWVTTIVISPGRDRQGLLFDILRIISVENKINLLSIHSRPDKKGGFLFYLDLEGHAGGSRIQTCLQNLRRYCREETSHTAEIVVFGTYRKHPFQQHTFSTVGIVGGKGAMGTWFERFFKSIGLQVEVFDKDTKTPIQEFVGRSEVILLSVPMPTMPEVAKKFAKHVTPGKLVVENCSVKQSALPILLDQFKPGVEILGMHTMFGDAISELSGENVVFTRTASSGPLAESFSDLFYKHGARVSQADGPEHDRNAAVLQSLVHILLIAFAEVARTTFDSRAAAEPFQTPNSRMLFLAAERVLQQNDKLVTDLQLLNPKAITARNELLAALFRAVLSLNEGKTEEFLSMLHRARKFFN